MIIKTLHSRNDINNVRDIYDNKKQTRPYSIKKKMSKEWKKKQKQKKNGWQMNKSCANAQSILHDFYPTPLQF